MSFPHETFDQQASAPAVPCLAYPPLHLSTLILGFTSCLAYASGMFRDDEISAHHSLASLSLLFRAPSFFQCLLFCQSFLTRAGQTGKQHHHINVCHWPFGKKDAALDLSIFFSLVWDKLLCAEEGYLLSSS